MRYVGKRLRGGKNAVMTVRVFRHKKHFPFSN